MKEKLFFFSLKHPLLYILTLAMVLRLLLAVFSDSLYVGTDHYFNIYRIPDEWFTSRWVSFITQFILGAFSLIIIILAYRITKIIADKTTALEIAVFMAFLWIFPVLSISLRASMVSIPFLLYGTLLIIKQDNLLNNNEKEKFHRTTFIVAGFFLGLGFAVYFNSLIYYIGILATLFILKNWKGALMTLTGYVIAVGLTQTFIDLLIYHRPFVSLTSFFSSLTLWNDNWIVLPIAILLALIPPMSVMLIFGFFRVWRKYILLFLPTFVSLIGFIFLYDTKLSFDEFINIILMVLPTYIIAGYVGWKEFYKNSAFWSGKKWLIRSCYIVFAVLNTVVFIDLFVEIL